VQERGQDSSPPSSEKSDRSEDSYDEIDKMQKDLKNINENLINRKLVYHREGTTGRVKELPPELPP